MTGAKAGSTDRSRRRLWAVLITLLAIAPVLAVVITRTGHSYVPTGDIGVTDLRVRDVWNGHIPLVGPFSRFGWSHPGPAMFLLLALPNGLFGHASWTTLVGGAALQGVAIVWLAVLAWRRGGLSLLVAVMTAVSLVYASTGTWVVLVPWNPYVALPFFCLVIFQVWLVATGEPKHLPGLAFVASFLVQTHVGYLPLVAALLVVGGVFTWRDRRATSTPWRRPLVFAGAITAVMWILPVIDVILDPPGNLAHMFKYFLTGGSGEEAIGVTHGLELIAAEFRLRPSWLGTSDRAGLLGGATTASVAWLLVPIALLGVSWWLSRGRPARDARRFWVISVVLLAASVVTLARVTGFPFPYLFQWRPVVAVVLVFASGGLVVVARRWFGHAVVRRTLAVLALAVMFTFSGSMAVAILANDEPVSHLEAVTAHLVDQVEDQVPAGGVILRLDTTSLLAEQKGLFDALARRDEPVFVDESVSYQYGDQYEAEPSDVDAVWWIAESGYARTVLEQLPGARVIASYSPLSPKEEARLQQLQREAVERLQAVGAPQYIPIIDSELLAFAVKGQISEQDHALFDAVAALNGKVARLGGMRSAIVAFPPKEAPEAVPYSEYVDFS